MPRHSLECTVHFSNKLINRLVQCILTLYLGVLYQRMLAKATPVPAEYKIVYPCDKGFEEDLGDLSKYDAVAWTGCSLTVYSGEPEVVKQIELAKQAFRLGIPQFGSCWAIQIAAVAAGGVCARNPRGREMGM